MPPVVGPSPPASQPIRRTCASGMNAWKMPMALEPPPTQAITTSGSRPVARALLPGLQADHPLEVPDHHRERVRAADRADAVVRVPDRRHPVAEGLVHRVLQRPGAGGDRDDLGAEHPHPGDVQRLPAGVFLAHVDGAVQAEQGARGGGRHAVLAGPGLRDEPGLAHPLGQQRLAEHVVDLVRPGVGEVLALEQHRAAARLLAEPLRAVQQRRAGGVAAEQPVEVGPEERVTARLLVGGGQLVQGRYQRLGREPAAVGDTGASPAPPSSAIPTAPTTKWPETSGTGEISGSAAWA